MNILICTPSAILDRPYILQNIIHLYKSEIRSIDDIIDYNILDLARAAAIVERIPNVKIFVKDMRNFSYWRIKQYIDHNKIDLLVLEGSTHQQSIYFKQIFQFIKFVKNSKPSIKIVLGGRDITFLYKVILKHFPFIDYIIVGETEKTLSELIQALINNINPSNIKKIPGLAFKEKDKLIVTLKRELIKNLDELPYLAYHYFNIHKDTTLLLSTSRGCPYNCKFCYRMFRNIRTHSPTYIADEINFLNKRYGITKFIFDDELSTNNKQWIFAFWEELKKNNLEISFACYSRVDTIDEEIIKILKLSGCGEIRFGVESGSNIILNNMNKKQTREQIINAFYLAKKNNIDTLCFLLIGFPGENEKTIKETIDIIKIIKPNKISPKLVTILPGTPFYRMAKKKRMINDDAWFQEYTKFYYTADYSIEQLQNFIRKIKIAFEESKE